MLDWLFGKGKSKSSRKPVKFIGWIRGTQDDRQVLVDLGVKGKMTWVIEGQGPYGIFEYCEISLETAKRLKNEYHNFIASTFTGVDQDGIQTEDQPLYRGYYEI